MTTQEIQSRLRTLREKYTKLALGTEKSLKIFERPVIWEMPVAGESYYIGATDSAVTDFSCFEVLNRNTGNQAAEWRGIPPGGAIEFADILSIFGHKFNDAEIAVECKGHGGATNSELLRRLEYPHIYRWKHIDKSKNFMAEFFGWYTNTKTRDIIISGLQKKILSESVIIHSRELWEEIFGFVSEGEVGDDRLMSLAICAHCSESSAVAA